MQDIVAQFLWPVSEKQADETFQGEQMAHPKVSKWLIRR
jgi:hypothetical protein